MLQEPTVTTMHHIVAAGAETACMQMWDLYSREKIDIKADIWVRSTAFQ